MADRNQLKVAASTPQADEDPFAELTRIMGFDPRIPVRPGLGAAPLAANGASATSDAGHGLQNGDLADEDFGVDLEKELMGDFEADLLRESEAVLADSQSEPVAELAESEPAAFAPEEAVAVEPQDPDAWRSETADYQAEPLASAEEGGDRFTWGEGDPDVVGDPDVASASSAPDLPVEDHRMLEDFEAALADVDMDFADEARPDQSEAPAEAQEDAVEMTEREEEDFYPSEALDTGYVPNEEAPVEDFPEQAQVEQYAEAPTPEPEPAKEQAAAADDPFATLAAMAARFRQGGSFDGWRQDTQGWRASAQLAAAESEQPAIQEPAPVAFETSDEPAAPEMAGDITADAGEPKTAPAAYEDDYFDLATQDVPEAAVAYADDLDIPEVPQEEAPARDAYEDLDLEFANLLDEINGPSGQPPVSGHASDDADEFEEELLQELGTGHSAVPEYAAGAAALGAGAAWAGQRAAQPVPGYGEAPAEDDFDFDPDLQEAMAVAAHEPDMRRRRGIGIGRGALVAGIVAGVAAIGGIGVFALSPGSGSGDAPTLVKADQTPIKVKPEKPGGTVIPNQDNKVYDTVAGKSTAEAAAPEQKSLVTNPQAPVDLKAAAAAASDAAAQPGENAVAGLAGDGQDAVALGEADAPSVKSEDRIEQLAGADEPDGIASVPVVAPRKVRTMIVKPDGTLVPREDPAPAAPEVAAATEAGADMTTATIAPGGDAVMPPANAPIAQPRPSERPAAAAPKPAAPAAAKPATVAMAGGAAATAAVAAADGAWAMQVASQPTEESARASYQALAQRYAGVLGGKPVSIVKADIAGKGTYWRVRIPAASRADAISLCESYKAAGGSCFVSK